MDLRNERDLYRKAARLLSSASDAPSIDVGEVRAHDWIQNRIIQRTIEAKATSNAVTEMLEAAGLLEDGYNSGNPGQALVRIVDRLTVEDRRKPSSRKKGRSDG